MSRTLLLALLLPLFAAECVAQFIVHDQRWVNVFGLLEMAVIAVRWFLGPQVDEERCPADCRRCAESLTGEEPR